MPTVTLPTYLDASEQLREGGRKTVLREDGRCLRKDSLSDRKSEGCGVGVESARVREDESTVCVATRTVVLKAGYRTTPQERPRPNARQQLYRGITD